MSETQAIDWESRYRDKTAGWERHGINPAFLAWRDSGALAPCRILISGGGRSLEPLALAKLASRLPWWMPRPARSPPSARISSG